VVRKFWLGFWTFLRYRIVGAFITILILYIQYYDQLIFWNFRTHRYVGLSLWLSHTAVKYCDFPLLWTF